MPFFFPIYFPVRHQALKNNWELVLTRGWSMSAEAIWTLDELADELLFIYFVLVCVCDTVNNSFMLQCEDMEALEQRLKQFNVEYTKRTIDDDKNGTKIDQLFFCDPDGYMIEMCNCENLKLVPAGSLGNIKLPCDRHNPPVDFENGHHAK